jgi:hypothetical protein
LSPLIGLLAHPPGSNVAARARREPDEDTMAISLYDASVGSYLQMLGAMGGFLDKGLAHFKENHTDLNAVVETRLIADMQPFRFQVQQAVHHSMGTIEALKHGQFSPQLTAPAHDYAGLQALVAQALAALHKVTPAEINAREGAEVVFVFGEYRHPYTAEGFVLYFSLPNLHFHATTAYDILRMKGVPIGKRDFMSVQRPPA